MTTLMIIIYNLPKKKVVSFLNNCNNKNNLKNHKNSKELENLKYNKKKTIYLTSIAVISISILIIITTTTITKGLQINYLNTKNL